MMIWIKKNVSVCLYFHPMKINHEYRNRFSCQKNFAWQFICMGLYKSFFEWKWLYEFIAISRMTEWQERSIKRRNGREIQNWGCLNGCEWVLSCLCVDLAACLSITSSICLSVCMSANLSGCLFVYLSDCLSTLCLSVRLSTLSVCLVKCSWKGWENIWYLIMCMFGLTQFRVAELCSLQDV